jgi:MFS family permease
MTTVRRLLVADLLGAIGCGLTQPYVVVFLHLGQGIAVAVATALLGLVAAAGLVGYPVGGTLIDRFGGRSVLAGGHAVSAAGLAAVAGAWGALGSAVGMALFGFGAALAAPALSTMLGAARPDATRLFTVEYALFNLGVAIGVGLGGLAIGHGRLAMQVQWLTAAAVMAGAAVAASFARVAAVGQPTVRGYRTALGDRRLLRILALGLLVMVAGYGLYNAAVPALSLLAADPRALVWAGLANCAVIVAGLPLALAVAGRLGPRRSVLTAAVLWSIGWLACALSAGSVGLMSARSAVVTAAVLTGACELLIGGALPAMVNGLAPAALRGRYNATLSLTLTAGNLVGPLLVALAVALGSLASAFAVGVVLLAGLALLGPLWTFMRRATLMPGSRREVRCPMAPAARSAESCGPGS